MGEKAKSALTKLVRWSVVLPVAFCIMMIMYVFDVVDHEEATTLRALLLMGSLIVFAGQIIFFFIALFLRKWWAVLGIFVGIAISVVITIFCIVALAAGQYRPPKQRDECDIVDTTEVDTTFIDIEEADSVWEE